MNQNIGPQLRVEPRRDPPDPLDMTVAKALGYERIELNPSEFHQMDHNWVDKDQCGMWQDHQIPRFTTSLDAIVGEIKRRKAKARLWCSKWLSQGALDEWSAHDCCRAILAYLEEHPNG